MAIEKLYHEGELAVQRRTKSTLMARMNGGMIGKKLPAGAMHYIAQQPMAVIGSLDAEGEVWASLLFGKPGFIRAMDEHTLVIDLSQPRSSQDDPLWINLTKNDDVGLLVIELNSRRRLRINGRARKITANRFVIDVERAYLNCPKYIQRREWKQPVDGNQLCDLQSAQGKELGEAQKILISNADTFFVASAHPEHGVDVSHRGGHPGFVQILSGRQLRIPDYAGNSMFNTLGNFASYPYAGLVFPDFNNGRLLQLTGRVEILWDLDDPCGGIGGTHRYWQFNTSHWQESMLPLHLDWTFIDYSPFIPERSRK